MVTPPSTASHVAPPRLPALGWAQLTDKQRALAIVGLVVEALVGVVVAAYAFMSMVGPGPVTQYYVWAARPAFDAGFVVACGACVCALWLGLPVRHAGPRAAVVATFGLGFLVGALGVATTYVRSSPESSLLRAAHQLTPPQGATEVRTSYGLEPNWPEGFAAGLVAAQSGEGPPAAVRSWRAPSASNACGQTGATAQGWADAGSLKVLPFSVRQNPGLACEWSARRHGWEVLVEVIYDPDKPQLGDYAVFAVGPPGLWCCTAPELAPSCC
jgi:hypothetical protein